MLVLNQLLLLRRLLEKRLRYFTFILLALLDKLLGLLYKRRWFGLWSGILLLCGLVLKLGALLTLLLGLMLSGLECLLHWMLRLANYLLICVLSLIIQQLMRLLGLWKIRCIILLILVWSRSLLLPIQRNILVFLYQFWLVVGHGRESHSFFNQGVVENEVLSSLTVYLREPNCPSFNAF